MANAPQSRNLIAVIFRNFINSLRPRQMRGTLIGTDYFGNKYYEIPANPQLGKRKPSRWFEPVEKDDFQQEMPAEWEAWLRGRRTEPPEEAEILKNVAIMKMKKENALKLEAKYGKEGGSSLKRVTKGPESFPKYDEYEIVPGKQKD